MKLNWNAAIGATMALLGTQTVIAMAEPVYVGMAAIVQKDVRLQLPGQTKNRHIGAMQSLEENSRLEVGPGGRAVVVLYKDGSRFSLPAGSVVRISADGVKAEAGKITALPPLNIQQARVLRGSRIAYGRSASVGVRGHNPIELKKLITGATLESRPTFEWEAVPGAVSYQVKLRDADDNVIFRLEAVDNKLPFPAGIAALKPSVDYLWSVSTVVGPDPYSDDGTFNVISDQERAEVQSELKALDTDTTDPDEQVMNAALQAEVYRKHHLFDEAIATYERLLEKTPDSAMLHLALADVLSGIGRNEASRIHRDKSTQLENVD